MTPKGPGSRAWRLVVAAIVVAAVIGFVPWAIVRWLSGAEMAPGAAIGDPLPIRFVGVRPDASVDSPESIISDTKAFKDWWERCGPRDATKDAAPNGY